jgi:hypothetical protein
MRVAIIAMMVLLLPAVLFAGPTMGVYFTFNAGQMIYVPAAPYEQFTGYVYAHNTACFLTAYEFALEVPLGVVIMGHTLPSPGYLELGDLLTGFSVASWPPMDGWNPGYNLLCAVQFMTIDFCACRGGTMNNAPIRVIAHPVTGLIQGACFPENNLFEYTGLTSLLCPVPYSVQETNWGAIKSLF